MTLRVHGTSAAAYTEMASSFLQGRLDVAPDLHDVAVVDGRGYYPFGPVPALLLLPFVAAFGRGVPNALLGVSALAIALPALYLLVRRGVPESRPAWWWLLATVAGTPLLACAFNDNPYYAAHVIVVACLAWALVLALDGTRPLLAGILVGLAAATRLDAIAAVIPVGLLYLEEAAGLRDLRGRRALIVAAGVAPFLVLMAWYNLARFDNPFESGYALQYLNYPWLAALRAQGLFSIRHVPENLYYFLVAGPIFADGARSLPSGFPWVVPSEWGMGMLWTSPWLFLALGARGRRAAFVAVGALAVLLPSLLYYGVGWIQFGYRYSLDALPFLLLLAVWGAQRLAISRRVLLPLFTWSLLVNAWGDLWLMGMWGLPRAYTG
jgi:hypothetical protein